MEVIISLVHPGETKQEDRKITVFATQEPAGRDEFFSAGEKGYKGIQKFSVWASEYDNQPEVEVNGRRLSVYRTYGPRRDDKIELYTAERIGNNGSRN